jgi:hypothetical protein
LLTLTRSYVRAEYEPIDQNELDSLGDYAFEVGEMAASEFLNMFPTGVRVQVQEGSVEIIVTIAAIGSILFSVVSNYGDFWDGLSRIKEHASLAGRFICTRILSRTKSQGFSRVTTGHLAQIERLFREVEAGKLTAEKATQKAMNVFVRAGEEFSQQLQDRIMEEFNRIPTHASGEETLRISHTIVDYRPLKRPQEIRTQRRARRKGVEIWRNPGERQKNKRRY